MISVCDQVENIVGKGENAGYQHFLLFPQCFQKASFPRAVKTKGLFGKSLIGLYFSGYSSLYKIIKLETLKFQCSQAQL